MRWVHYSGKVMSDLILDVKQNSGMKPKGLWITPDDDSGEYTWANFCRDSDFRVQDLSVIHEVELSEKSRILTIHSSDDLREFTLRYRSVQQFFDPVYVYSLDWRAVAREYSGILIPTHHWTARLEPDTVWYSSWDCASGCIWDSSAIQSVRPVSSRAA